MPSGTSGVAVKVVVPSLLATGQASAWSCVCVHFGSASGLGMIPAGKCWMMSLTSSLALPPNDIDTVESGCDAAGAELGLAEKSVMENVACAEPGEASMRKNAASDVATGV